MYIVAHRGVWCLYCIIILICECMQRKLPHARLIWFHTNYHIMGQVQKIVEMLVAWGAKYPQFVDVDVQHVGEEDYPVQGILPRGCEIGTPLNTICTAMAHQSYEVTLCVRSPE